MSLDKELKKELSNNLETLCIGLFTNRYTYWAQHIREAVKFAGTDERHLIELVMMMNDYD